MSITTKDMTDFILRKLSEGKPLDYDSRYIIGAALSELSRLLDDAQETSRLTDTYGERIVRACNTLAMYEQQIRAEGTCLEIMSDAQEDDSSEPDDESDDDIMNA